MMKKIFNISMSMMLMTILLLLLTLMLCIGCDERIDYEKERKNDVATPTFNPKGGTYYQSQKVSIISTTPGATIRYTTDGSEPTQSSIIYNKPIEVTVGTIVKAKAYKSGCFDSEITKAEYSFQIATPTFDPDEGLYHNSQTVVVSCITEGVLIIYTIDGSEPDMNANGYTKPILIEKDTILKARAYREGWSDAQTKTAEYQFNIATPTISPPGGMYSEPQTVSITCETEEATIRYTTDGSIPDSASHNYTEPILVSQETALTVQAFRTDWSDSEIRTAEYKFQPATPVFDPPGGTYNQTQIVTISSETEGATIRYTTDGSEPTQSSTLYSKPVDVTQSVTLKAKAFKTGWTDSKMAVSEYKYQVGTPTFSPEGGTYHNIQTVTISCETNGATIRYTTDGSEPTQSSTIYSKPIDVAQNLTLKAKAFKTGWTDSKTISAEYKYQIATPTFNPPGGTYNQTQSVTIACETDGATIRYTNNGSEPTQSSAIYDRPIEVASGTTLKAKAFRTGWIDSETGKAEYQFQVATPTFNPPGGTYNVAQNVTVSCATEGATIRYTTNGSEPTQSSIAYSKSIELDSGVTLKAKAFKTGWSDSKTGSAVYKFQVATPTFNPPGGRYTARQTVTINCATKGATIRYTTDGSEPTHSYDVYSKPLDIELRTTIKAQAIKGGWTDSPVASATYQGSISPEMVYVPGGTFTMGRTKGTGNDNELPNHSVTLASFYIGKYLVTQSEYEHIMENNPDPDHGIGPEYPVYRVSWYSAVKFCNLLSMLEGLTPVYSISGSTNPANWGSVPTSDNNSTWDAAICNWSANGYRLPTEAEWEYAARGSENTPNYLYSGSDDIDDVAWYYDNNTPYGSKPVGGKQPNGLGIYDMSGNLREWCWDWYDKDYYSKTVSHYPKGPSSGYYRLHRGGDWNTDAKYCRVAARDCSNPYVAYYHIGFRVCKTAD